MDVDNVNQVEELKQPEKLEIVENRQIKEEKPSPLLDESIESSKRLFDIFDIVQNTSSKFQLQSYNQTKTGKIELQELRTILKSLHLHPTNKELKNMMGEITHNPTYSITFEQFRAMREMKVECELNVIAEFKKFDIHKVHRGILTKECIQNVLYAEGFRDLELINKTNHVLKHDLDRDGKITFRELYDSILKRIPQEWLEWIADKLELGVKDEYVLKILILNGIDEEIAAKIVHRTKFHGRQYIQRTFADFCKGYIYKEVVIDLQSMFSKSEYIVKETSHIIAVGNHTPHILDYQIKFGKFRRFPLNYVSRMRTAWNLITIKSEFTDFQYPEYKLHFLNLINRIYNSVQLRNRSEIALYTGANMHKYLIDCYKKDINPILKPIKEPSQIFLEEAVIAYNPYNFEYSAAQLLLRIDHIVQPDLNLFQKQFERGELFLKKGEHISIIKGKKKKAAAVSQYIVIERKLGDRFDSNDWKLAFLVNSFDLGLNVQIPLI